MEITRKESALSEDAYSHISESQGMHPPPLITYFFCAEINDFENIEGDTHTEYNDASGHLDQSCKIDPEEETNWVIKQIQLKNKRIFRIEFNARESVGNKNGEHNKEGLSNTMFKRELLSYNRREKSLEELSKRFLSLFLDKEESLLSLDKITNQLGVERRRIYDIINILESLKLVSRKGKNNYKWNGFRKIYDTIHEYLEKGESPMHDLIDPLELSQTNNNNDQKQQSSSYLQQKREKSLEMLSIGFLKLFLHWKPIMTLEEAARRLSAVNIDSHKIKTKIRRLYDIANVFKSLGLIRKTTLNENKKPAFAYVGESGLDTFAQRIKEERENLSKQKTNSGSSNSSSNTTTNSINNNNNVLKSQSQIQSKQNNVSQLNVTLSQSMPNIPQPPLLTISNHQQYTQQQSQTLNGKLQAITIQQQQVQILDQHNLSQAQHIPMKKSFSSQSSSNNSNQQQINTNNQSQQDSLINIFTQSLSQLQQTQQQQQQTNLQPLQQPSQNNFLQQFQYQVAQQQQQEEQMKRFQQNSLEKSLLNNLNQLLMNNIFKVMFSSISKPQTQSPIDNTINNNNSQQSTAKIQNLNSINNNNFITNNNNTNANTTANNNNINSNNSNNSNNNNGTNSNSVSLFSQLINSLSMEIESSQNQSQNQNQNQKNINLNNINNNNINNMNNNMNITSNSNSNSNSNLCINKNNNSQENEKLSSLFQPTKPYSNSLLVNSKNAINRLYQNCNINNNNPFLANENNNHGNNTNNYSSLFNQVAFNYLKSSTQSQSQFNQNNLSCQFSGQERDYLHTAKKVKVEEENQLHITPYIKKTLTIIQPKMDEEQDDQQQQHSEGDTPKRQKVLQDRTNAATVIKRAPPLDISMQSSFKKIKKDSGKISPILSKI